MPRGTADPARLAAEIGRQVTKAAAGLSRGKTGRIEVDEIPLGKITMSGDVGKRITSTLTRKLDAVINGGKK